MLTSPLSENLTAQDFTEKSRSVNWCYNPINVAPCVRRRLGETWGADPKDDRSDLIPMASQAIFYGDSTRSRQSHFVVPKTNVIYSVYVSSAAILWITLCPSNRIILHTSFRNLAKTIDIAQIDKFRSRHSIAQTC